jgi:hypothetical protein
MSKYTTLEQVIEATIDHFNNQSKLGYRSPDKLYLDGLVACYSHVEGSQGCAIGCHLTPAQAEKLDEIGDEKGQYQMWSMYNHELGKEILEGVFDGIDPKDLAHIQRMHDNEVMWVSQQLRLVEGRDEYDQAERERIDKEGVRRFVDSLKVLLMGYTEEDGDE